MSRLPTSVGEELCIIHLACKENKTATHNPGTAHPDRDQTNQNQPLPKQRATTTKGKKKQERGLT